MLESPQQQQSRSAFVLTATYAIEITKPVTVPGLGELLPRDIVLASGDRVRLYRRAPLATGNPLLHIYAMEAGDLLNPDPQCVDLAAVVGLSGPHHLAPLTQAPSSHPASPPPRGPGGRARLHRLK